MYDRVLVPTDGSDGTRGAIDHAIDHALTYDAALHTLYAVETPAAPEGAAGAALEALEEAGKDAIDEVIHRAEMADVETVEGVVGQGSPHRVILDYVDDEGIDLVVMGTHGRTGLDRYLLGSVTERVVRLSEVPVLTVRLPAESSNES